MNALKSLLVLISVLLVSNGLMAQVDFIKAADFATLIKANPKVVVIDGNKAKTFATSHIKGAININHMDLYQKGDIEGLLLPAEDMAKFFGNLGINEKSEVVIYDDGTLKYNTRLYYILKYLGAENVKLLHKDMAEWAKVRLPLTAEVAKLSPVTFTPVVNESMLATMQYVMDNKDKGEVVLLDARNADEFAGKTENSKGHIPGAKNLDFNALVLANGAYKPMEEMKKIVADMGITPDKQVIVYCQTGVRASVLYIAFKNVLGFENVKVYDGSYNEWFAKNTVVQ
ncbi:MAG: sulfurtransferase [Haliscomenobacter sp.]|nr:sulfurtransferase [Haliscomenobacter sp.]MBK8654220.1 sulfurtransferase [Haliscomenobacter sp.]MBP9076441.1 sulfurtransferase [Haliscomenobacter sp.]